MTTTDKKAVAHLPPFIRKALPYAVIGLAFLLLLLAIRVDLLLPGAAMGALAFVLVGFAVDLENMAKARRRVQAYRELGIAISPQLQQALRWRLSPADISVLVVAAYLILGALNATYPLPDAVLLLALLVLVLNPFVLAFFVLRRRARQREEEMRAFAEQHGLAFSAEGKGRQGTLVAEEPREGPRVYCVQTENDLSLMVPVRKSREGLGLQPATWRYRRATKLAGLQLTTGDEAFDRQFVIWNDHAQRSAGFLADADVRRTLLLLSAVAPLYLTIGEGALSMSQAYGQPGREYLQALLSVALRLARRWDDQRAPRLPDPGL